MPYIDKKSRERFVVINTETGQYLNLIDRLFEQIKTEGELNYVITKLLHEVIRKWGLSYTNLNLVIGILECVKLEIYRMVAAPYENLKAKTNGNISELDKNEVPKLSFGDSSRNTI